MAGKGKGLSISMVVLKIKLKAVAKESEVGGFIRERTVKRSDVLTSC